MVQTVWVGNHPEDIKKVQYANYEYQTAMSIIEYLLERNLDRTPQMDYWIEYANKTRVIRQQAMAEFKHNVLDALQLKPYTQWSIDYDTNNITCY